jgi:hypothetical protein
LGAVLIAGVAAGTLAHVAAGHAGELPSARQGSHPLGRSTGTPATVRAGARDEPAPPGTAARGREDHSRISRSLALWRSSSAARGGGSDHWYAGIAGIALALAACGGVVAAARHLSSRGSVGEIQVISRVNLSPRHSIYLVRVGRRALLIGAGPQGAPSLISELDDPALFEPDAAAGGEA